MAISRLPGTRRLIIGPDIKSDELETRHYKADSVTGDKIGPEAIDGYVHDHISHDWEKTGTVTNIPVGTPGWMRRLATYAEPFPTSTDLILHSLKFTVSGCPPSGLKIFTYASALLGPLASGIAFHIDINASATPGAFVNLDWLARGH